MIKPLVAAFLILAGILAAPVLGAPGLIGSAWAQAPIAAPVGPPAETPAVAPLAGTEATGDASGSFSLVNMFWRADYVVKAVMILLLVASLWSWTIIFNKLVALSGLKRKARKFEKLFWSGQSLDELYQQFAAHND